jgi:hypothetical protein
MALNFGLDASFGNTYCWKGMKEKIGEVKKVRRVMQKG